MLSHRQDPAGVRHGGPDWYRADDLILRARRERARWLEGVIRSGLARLRGTRLGTWLAERERRAEVQDLLGLDDRTLADIGLRREELIAVRSGHTSFERLTAARAAPASTRPVALRRAPEGRPAVPAELDRAA